MSAASDGTPARRRRASASPTRQRARARDAAREEAVAARVEAAQARQELRGDADGGAAPERAAGASDAASVPVDLDALDASTPAVSVARTAVGAISLTRAIKGTLDGSFRMFSARLDLFRGQLLGDAEALRGKATDQARGVGLFARLLGQNMVLLAACASVLVASYLMLCAAVVLLVHGLVGQLWITAATLGGIALLNLLVGAIGMWRAARVMSSARVLLRDPEAVGRALREAPDRPALPAPALKALPPAVEDAA